VRVKNLVIGVLMIIYVTFGGMKGTTWVKIVKAVMLMLGTVLITFLVLAKFGFNLCDLLAAAARKIGQGRSSLATRTALREGSGRQVRLLVPWLGASTRHRWPTAHPISLLHHTNRPGGTQVGALGNRTDRFVLLDDAGARLRCRCAGPDRQVAARSRPSAGNAESPLLAQSVGGGEGTVGGSVLLTLVSAVAFATIPAVVAGLTLTSASSVADDLYANVIKKGQASARSELIVAWLAAFAIWTIAILLAIPAQRLNIAFLVALAFVVAASANVPALLYNLFWKPFNTTGAIFSIYGGLFTSYQNSRLRLRPRRLRLERSKSSAAYAKRNYGRTSRLADQGWRPRCVRIGGTLSRWQAGPSFTCIGIRTMSWEWFGLPPGTTAWIPTARRKSASCRACASGVFSG
jgi:cation/acetate symporter